MNIVSCCLGRDELFKSQAVVRTCPLQPTGKGATFQRETLTGSIKTGIPTVVVCALSICGSCCFTFEAAPVAGIVCECSE